LPTAITAAAGEGDDDVPRASEVGAGGGESKQQPPQTWIEEAAELTEMSDMGKVARWCLMSRAVIVAVWAKNAVHPVQVQDVTLLKKRHETSFQNIKVLNWKSWLTVVMDWKSGTVHHCHLHASTSSVADHDREYGRMAHIALGFTHAAAWDKYHASTPFMLHASVF
jgi:hypothetical protein